jgi:cysteine synthase
MSASLPLQSTGEESVRRRAVERLRARGVVLPRFSELAAPAGAMLSDNYGAARADPSNLLHVHWFNSPQRLAGRLVPDYLVLPPELTSVAAPIVVMLGYRFPMIGAHKVLAAYACLAPRLAAGAFDPTSQRAVWPSTGNYCRGGVAISRILGCRGVAVLPEMMSPERFHWLEEWTQQPEDIIRTPGSESNVKEIYDACAALSRDPTNVIINQFSEFANYLIHYLVTGAAAERLFEGLSATKPGLSLAAFVAGTGSAGTIAAGDYLKQRFGASIAAVEPLECPTLLYNGFGAHNIQGVGDKHVPLIHNIMNTDVVIGISDAATNDLDLVFNSDLGRDYLVRRRGIPGTLAERLPTLGLSSICNILAAIKLARRLELGPDQAILTIATDSADLYAEERAQRLAALGRDYAAFDVAEAVGRWLLGGESDHVLELAHRDRSRIFNLGYYTWVEQQNVTLEAFEERRRRAFWRELQEQVPVIDALIDRFNTDTGLKRSAVA